MKSRIILFLSILIVSITCNAQSNKGYFIGKNFVSYNDSLMKDADAATFVVLGQGVAKDKNHIYNEGRIMEYADKAAGNAKKQENTTEKQEDAVVSKNNDDDDDSSTFLDKLFWTDDVSNKYTVNGSSVAYNGKTIKKADATTFKYIGGDYAVDKHHAYYKGRLLGDAWGSGHFTYKGNGYATDGVHWYCNGKPVDRD